MNVDARLLLDENVSPRLAEDLRAAGHDAVHVNEVRLTGAPDAVIMVWAAQRRRVVVTHDHDYVDNAFTLRAGAPSIIKLVQRGEHGLIGREAQAARLHAVLPGLRRGLADGAIVVLGRNELHTTRLPLLHRVLRRGPEVPQR